MTMPTCNQGGCTNRVERPGDTFCSKCNGALGFNEDHRVGPSREGGSIKRSHRAEGRNWVD